MFSFDNKRSRFRFDAWKGEFSWAYALIDTFFALRFSELGGIKTWDIQNSIYKSYSYK